MLTTPSQLTTVLTAIHARPHMIVLEFAGAGAQALAWLHSVGGSSRTILEATDRYASTSLAEAIGYTPQKATAPEVAQSMAQLAYQRARELATTEAPVVGVGCTATIATDRQKRGDHRCCIAVCSGTGLMQYELIMHKGYRTRQEEEELVSLLILRSIADVCDIQEPLNVDLASDEVIDTQFIPAEPLMQLMNETVDWVKVTPDGQLSTGRILSDVALLSGSFNPLHDGHQQLARVVASQLRREVLFELPLVNAEKAPIDLKEAHRRSAQFAGYATLLFTRAPLFTQKVVIFPRSVFVLGIDTAKRLTQLRFYDSDPKKMDLALNAIRSAGCRFLVAGRVDKDGQFLTLSDANVPPQYADLLEEIPPESFRMDISSSALRAEKEAEHAKNLNASNVLE